MCAVDALDECEESSRALLLKSLAEYYSRTSNRSKLRMVITSRPNTLIGDNIWYHEVDLASIYLTEEHES